MNRPRRSDNGADFAVAQPNPTHLGTPHREHPQRLGGALTLLDGVGHYPMLEAPVRWADALVDHLPV